MSGHRLVTWGWIEAVWPPAEKYQTMRSLCMHKEVWAMLYRPSHFHRHHKSAYVQDPAAEQLRGKVPAATPDALAFAKSPHDRRKAACLELSSDLHRLWHVP